MNLLPWRKVVSAATTMDTRPPLVVVGQSPPPYHGQAIMIQSLVEGLDKTFAIHHVRMQYSLTIDDIGLFSIRKLVHLFSLMFATITLLLRHRKAALYYPPAGPNRVPVLRDIAFLLAVRPFAHKTIFHFHTVGLSTYLESQPHLRPWARWAYQKPDVAIVLSDSNRKDAEYIQSRQIYQIPNGMAIPAHPRVPATDGKLRLLFVGMHEEQKGVRDMIATAHRLKECGFRFVINSVGEWRSEEERLICEELVRTYHLEAEVHFCGRLVGDAKWDMFAASDVFFFPTFYPLEAFSVVLIEALAFGLPIVSTEWHGPKDVVSDGISGVLCPIHDIAGFADAIVRLGTDTTFYNTMSRAARWQYEQSYTEEMYLSQLAAVFHETYITS